MPLSHQIILFSRFYDFFMVWNKSIYCLVLSSARMRAFIVSPLLYAGSLFQMITSGRTDCSGSIPPVQVMGKRSVLRRLPGRRSPTTATPHTGAIQTCAGRHAQRPFRGNQHEYAWQHPPAAVAALHSPGSLLRPAGVGRKLPITLCYPHRSHPSALSTSAAQGSKNPPLLCTVAVNQSSYAASGRTTTIRFSSVGLWN